MDDVFSQAREQAFAQGSGSYLKNAQLAQNQLIFSIVDVVFQEGQGYMGGDRWRLRLVPYYDDEQDPDGYLSIAQTPDNEIRRNYMKALQGVLAKKEADGEPVELGPACLVYLKGKSANYYEIVGWNETEAKPVLPQGAVLVGVEVEAEPIPPRRPAGRLRPSQSPTAASSAPSPRATSAVPATTTPAVAPSPAPASAAPAPTEASLGPDKGAEPPFVPAGPGAGQADDRPGFPGIREWLKTQPGGDTVKAKGRVSREWQEKYDAARMVWLNQQAQAQHSQQLPPAAHPLAQPRVPVSAPEPAEGIPAREGRATRQDLIRGQMGEPGYPQAQHAQQITARAGTAGHSIDPCPSCGKIIRDRIFPRGGSGELVVIHADCEGKPNEGIPPAKPTSLLAIVDEQNS